MRFAVVAVLALQVGITEAKRNYAPSKVPPGKLRALLDLDVVSYFDLSEKYSTPLQAKLFKRTSEYAIKLKELRGKLRQVKKQTLITCGIDRVRKYDLKKRGIPIWLSMTAIKPGDSPKETVGGVWLRGLRVREVWGGDSRPGWQRQLLVKMNAAEGLTVEKAKDVDLCFKYRPLSVRSYQAVHRIEGRVIKLDPKRFPVGRPIAVVFMDGDQVLLTRPLKKRNR